MLIVATEISGDIDFTEYQYSFRRSGFYLVHTISLVVNSWIWPLSLPIETLIISKKNASRAETPKSTTLENYLIPHQICA